MVKHTTMSFIERNFDKLRCSLEKLGINYTTPKVIYESMEYNVQRDPENPAREINDVILNVLIVHKLIELHNWCFRNDPLAEKLLELEIEDNVFAAVSKLDEHEDFVGDYRSLREQD